jgi:hypothetical protein
VMGGRTSESVIDELVAEVSVPVTGTA